MKISKQEVIQKINAYLEGLLSKEEVSTWAISVLTKQVFNVDEMLLEDAITALAGLHDEDERWDTAEEDLLFFKQCLEGKRPYLTKIEVLPIK
ncbi:MAG: hypothetical protein AB1393_09155 [Candidatus Edwardsbacteria bacterium]